MFGGTVGGGGDRLDSFDVSAGDIYAAVFINSGVHSSSGCCCSGCRDGGSGAGAEETPYFVVVGNVAEFFCFDGSNL